GPRVRGGVTWAVVARTCLRTLLAAAIVAALTTACSSDPAPAAPDRPPQNIPPPRPAVRVLMVTATAGYRHDSIETARQTVAALGASSGEFGVTATEDLSMISRSGLAPFDVLFFAMTSGELPLTADQQAAMLEFVSGGKGFLGAHSA